MAAKPQVPLATEGGPKAVPQLGPYPSKLGREELRELIDLWKLSPGNKERTKEILDSDLRVEVPHLFRYYNPQPSGVAAAEEAMRKLIGTQHCLTVNSCTSALIACCRAIAIGRVMKSLCPLTRFSPVRRESLPPTAFR